MSYGRKDDEPFVEALRDYLECDGVSVWWDRTHMQARGTPFLHVIDDAIRSVDKVVLVVGREALASSYVDQELRVAEETCKIVIRVLRGSDPETVKATLGREHVYDVRDVVFSKLTAAQKRTLDGLVAELKSSATAPGPLRGVPALPEHVNRRPAEVAHLVDLLLADVTGPVVLSAGMGGIGKSVLAGLVARSCPIRRAFAGVLFTRREQDDTPVSIVNDLLRLADESPPGTGNLATSTLALKELLSRAPYLLVVDNVWTSAQVAAVANVADGSRARVLLTSRVRDIAVGLSHRRIEPVLLSPEQSRAHLASWVGTTAERLPPEADTVVEHCGGLLLALSLCGAFLNKEYSSWQELARALSQFQLAELNLELQNYESPGAIAAMDVSLRALRKRSSQCSARYRTLATFGTARPVPFEMVAAMWHLSSDDELAAARRDLRELHEASLLTLLPGDEHVLHDIQRAFLLSTGPNEATLRKHFLSSFEAREGLLAGARRHDWLRQVLVEYLITSENWDELDRLFAEETETAENIWSSLRIARDELDQYLDDWTRITRGCGRLEPAEQIRWLTSAALTRASLANRARNTPWALVCAAVRHRLWTPRRATATLRFLRPEDRAMGLATLVALDVEGNRDRALSAFFETLSACHAKSQADALRQLRRTLRPSECERVRPHAHAFVAARPRLAPDVLEQLLTFFAADNLDGLAAALDATPEVSAILTRLMLPEAARERVQALDADRDLTTVLRLWYFACFDRELLLGEELRELVSAALDRPFTLNTPYLMRLLSVASEPNLRTVAPVLTREAWGRLLADTSAVTAKDLLGDVTSPALIPGLAAFMRRDEDSGWRAAGLARLAAASSGRSKAELLIEVEAGIEADLRHSEERGDFSGLSDLMSDLVRVWRGLRSTTRATLLARIASLPQRYGGAALSPLFAVEPDATAKLAQELLSSLRYVQAWYEVLDPVGELAPHLGRSEVELALDVTEAGRDAGFEFSHAFALWSQLDARDRTRARVWLLHQMAEHLNAPGGDAEWQVAGNLSALSMERPWSPEVLEGARRLAWRVQKPEHAAVCFAAIAACETGRAAEEDWARTETYSGKITDAGTRGFTCAKLARLAASASRSERFCDEALRVEGGLREALGSRDSWPWRLKIIQELPDGATTSQRAMKLLGEVYFDKLDSYAPGLLPKCDIATLLGQLARFERSDVGRDTIRALVRRLSLGGEPEAALRIARLHEWPAVAIDELASGLSLEQTRVLLAKSTRPALVERLAELGEFDEALDAAKQLHGVERFQAVVRCCKHAPTPVIVEPLLAVLSDLEASDTLRGALAVAADVWPRLPESARLTACRAALDLIGMLPRQIAIPSLYLLSPVLVSFQPESAERAAESILDTIFRVTRWWPAYPRPVVAKVEPSATT